MAKASKKAVANIVSGVGVAASKSNEPGLSKRIESAMAQAVTDALADGINDPDEQRARMMAARAEVLKG